LQRRPSRQRPVLDENKWGDSSDEDVDDPNNDEPPDFFEMPVGGDPADEPSGKVDMQDVEAAMKMRGLSMPSATTDPS
jgi:hypothetical protein